MDAVGFGWSGSYRRPRREGLINLNPYKSANFSATLIEMPLRSAVGCMNRESMTGWMPAASAISRRVRLSAATALRSSSRIGIAGDDNRITKWLTMLNQMVNVCRYRISHMLPDGFARAARAYDRETGYDEPEPRDEWLIERDEKEQQ